MGMRERARQLGGRLSITSEPGAGSCLQLFIPLEVA
jgi:signal transduction histidine kinase